MASGPSPPSGSPTGACSLPASAARSAAVSRASSSSRRAGGPSSPTYGVSRMASDCSAARSCSAEVGHDQQRIRRARRRVPRALRRDARLDAAVRIPAAGREQGRAMIGQPGEPAERAQDTEQRRRFRPRTEQQHQRRRLQRDGSRRRQVRRELVPGQQRGAPRLVQRHQRVVDRGRAASGSTGRASTRMRPRQPEPEPNSRSSSERVSNVVSRGCAGGDRRAGQFDERRARDNRPRSRRPGRRRRPRAPAPRLAVGRAFGVHDQRQREGAAGGAQPARRLDHRTLPAAPATASGAELEGQLTQPLVPSARPARWRRPARSAACPVRRRRPASRVLGTMCTSTRRHLRQPQHAGSRRSSTAAPARP